MSWFSLPPKCTGETQSNPGGCYTGCGFVSQLRKPELGKTRTFIVRVKKTCPDFAPKSDTVCIILAKKQKRPSVQERYTVSSKAVVYIDIFEKIVRMKGYQCLSSRDTQKCQRPMENYLPTTRNKGKTKCFHEGRPSLFKLLTTNLRSQKTRKQCQKTKGNYFQLKMLQLVKMSIK